MGNDRGVPEEPGEGIASEMINRPGYDLTDQRQMLVWLIQLATTAAAFAFVLLIVLGLVSMPK